MRLGEIRLGEIGRGVTTRHPFSRAFHYFNMLPLGLYNTEFGPFREIIISRATSGGRREIELNSGSLPPIPGGLATLVRTLKLHLFGILNGQTIRMF